MLYTIQNESLRVTVSDFGAELQSIVGADGTEYLWQGDPKIWSGRSPVLFPYVSRLTQNSYCLDGQIYHMELHGLAMYTAFRVAAQSDTEITLEMTDSEETYARYPRKFAFWVTYRLEGNRMAVTYFVENRDTRMMPFGMGGHPGIRVPLRDGLSFADYRLQFAAECAPIRVGITDKNYLSGQDSAYFLEDNRDLPLRHDLFDGRTLILREHTRRLKLKTDLDSHAVELDFPQMPYLGVWHMPHTEAPYVCIEPWLNIHCLQDQIPVLETQAGLIHLPAGKTYENKWSMTFFA